MTSNISQKKWDKDLVAQTLKETSYYIPLPHLILAFQSYRVDLSDWLPLEFPWNVGQSAILLHSKHR